MLQQPGDDNSGQLCVGNVLGIVDLPQQLTPGDPVDAMVLVTSFINKTLFLVTVSQFIG